MFYAIVLDFAVVVLTTCVSIVVTYYKRKPPCKQMFYDLTCIDCLYFCLVYFWIQAALATLNLMLEFTELEVKLSTGN